MAGERYTPEQVSAELDALLPGINKGSSMPVPKELAMSLLMVENMDKNGGVAFTNAVSPAGAQGVGQVMPGTLQLLKKGGFLPAEFPDDLRNASLREQIQASLAAVREIIGRTKTTDPDKVGANYNASPHATKRFMETGNSMYLPAETQLYLPKIQKAYEMLGVEYPSMPQPADVRPSAQLAGAFTDASAQFAKNMSLLPEVMKALTGANITAQEQNKIQQTAVTNAANSAAEAARLSTEELLSQQAVHQDIIKAVGLDVRDPQAAIRVELDKAATARVQREALDSKITELQSKSLFSDPLGWLMAIPQIAELVPQYNQQATLENNANATIAKLQSVAASAINLTPARSADLLRAKAAAEGQAKIADAQAINAQLTAQNAAGIAKTKLDELNINRNMFSEILQLDSRNAQMFLKELQMEAKSQADAEKKLKDLQESTLLNGMNMYRKVIAGNVPDYTSADLKTMPPHIREAWHKVVSRGGFGNYKDAIMFIDEYGNEVGAAETGNATMMQMVRKLRAEATALAPAIANKHNSTNPFSKIDNKVATQIAYDQLYKQALDTASSNFDKGALPANSPYAIDFDALAASAKGMPNNTVSKVLLAAKERSPYKTLNGVLTPRGVLDAVEAEVRAGAVAPAKAAAEMAGFFKSAEDAMYTSNGLRYLGLPKLQEFTIKPGATGNKQVDLFNQSQLESYLTAQVAQAKRIKTAQESSLFNMGVIPLGQQQAPSEQFKLPVRY